MQTAYRHTMTVVILVVVSVLISACSPQRRQQAEMTVRTADSLRAAGQYYNASAALAEAVSALRPLRFFRRNSYAHACYHYGRLLIDSNHPLPAVEQLLQAEHYAPRDYSLLGHVQTNLAYVCQLELRWMVAYDLYETAGTNFILVGDTISYYYSLASMAFTSTYLNRYDTTYTLLNYIQSNCSDSSVIRWAEVSLMLLAMDRDYSEVIARANSLLAHGMHQSLAELYKAKAFHYLAENDSACYYAQLVINNSSSLSDKCNAYYILTNDDAKADTELLQQRASTRADIQREMQHRQAELTQAVDYYLQQQQISKRRKIALFIGFFVLLGVLCAVFVLYSRRKKHKKDIISLHKKNRTLQLSNQDLQQSNMHLQSEQAEQYRQILSDIESTCQTLLANPNWMKVMQWDDYKSLCRNINVRFYRLEERLQAINSMKEQEVRLCVLVLMNLSHKEIAGILRCSHTSIGRFKENTAQKLGVHGGELRMRLLELLGAK